MKNPLLPLLKITSMSSIEIADLTNKKHSNVLRDIRVMLSELYDLKQDSNLNPESDQNSKMDPFDIEGVNITYADNGMTKQITLEKHHTLVLITGYSAVLRDIVLKRWQYLEEQLNILKFREGDKKHQLAAMEALHHMLPDDLKGEELAFVKANTVVNKATSNLFGFPKMINKPNMSPDMLVVREKVMDDYLKLYEVFEDNSLVADLLYKKYQPKRLEASCS